MDVGVVTDILKIAQEIEAKGFGEFAKDLEESFVLGSMVYNSALRESQICQLVGARLGVPVVDLSWHDVESKETGVLLDELVLASEAVNLLLTAYASNETFGEGRKVTRKFPAVSRVPVVSLHDDIYNWQTALAHLHGFRNHLGDLYGKRVVVSWGFGSQFVNPATAHALVISSALSGAKVRVVAPQEFPILNRVKRESEKADRIIEDTTYFSKSFEDADAVYALNWLCLDEYNHPERNAELASKYKDWYLTEDLLPASCVLSTGPSIQSDVTISSELLMDKRCVNSTWLTRRVQVLAASVMYALREKTSII